MPRKSSNYTKHQINLEPEDWRKLQSLFPTTGPTIAVRRIINMYVAKNWKEEELLNDDNN